MDTFRKQHRRGASDDDYHSRHHHQFVLGMGNKRGGGKKDDLLLGRTDSDDDDDNHHHHHNNTGSGSSSSNAKEQHNNNRTTDGQTMMHILKANIGTGVLAMPNAFKNVGLWLGFILVPIIGAICIHCMNILIASHNHLCDRFNYESLDYDQVAALGLACGPKFARRLAKRAHIVVTIFLIFTQVGFCCVYIMFVVENLQLAVLNLFKIEYSTTTYLLLVFPLIGLTSCTSNLQHLARISTMANVLQLAGLALIFFDLLQFHTFTSGDQYMAAATHAAANNSSTGAAAAAAALANANRPQQPQVSEFVSDDIVNGLPLFFATAVYAFEGIGVVLPLIKEMQHPSRISGSSGVLNTSMTMVAMLYMAMGFFGYSKYGASVQGSITLNLPETPLNELVRLIFAIAIGLSYSLQFYVPWTIMWPYIDESLFYSYRPRESRDKLEILNKLSAENEWAIDESDFQQSTTTQQSASPPKQQQQQQQPSPPRTIEEGKSWANEAASSGAAAAAAAADDDDLDDERQQQQLTSTQQLQLDNNSTASTFATSYTLSTVLGPQQHQLSTGKAAQRRFNLSSSLAGQQPPQQQYGTLSSLSAASTAAATTTTRPGVSGAAGGRQPQRRRNRLEDVMEQADVDDSMPEVQWRPPPRSMRGKRKLVRYTVILVTVSFTFVAAALIPRLDLFISLIGALASSCLAIIFPAVIQMCTFWGSAQEDSAAEEEDEAEAEEHRHRQIGNDHDDEDSLDSHKAGPAKRRRRRRILWSLFIFKNSLLIVFGILGLITGSWISISQLGDIYMGIVEPQ